MAPGIALEAIGKGRKKLTVLDPMMGSGTVLAVAGANGHRAVGIDLDPLAVLLGKVWTQPLDREALKKRASIVLTKAKEEFSQIRVGAAYPAAADEETRKFVRYWFDPYARRQLTALSRVISRLRNPIEKDALWCAFSRLIITKSAGASLAMDLSHSRPHRQFETAPVKPFDKFLTAVEVIAANSPETASKKKLPPAQIHLGDARLESTLRLSQQHLS